MSFRSSEGRIWAKSALIDGGVSFLPPYMNPANEFRPRLPDPALVFSYEGLLGRITDLKAGLRLFLERYFPASVALFMSQSANFNYLMSMDRSARVIIMTADGSPMVESILIDLYAKLLQNRSTITTSRTVYTATLEGSVDLNRVNIVSHHNFWLSTAFTMAGDVRGERFLLN